MAKAPAVCVAISPCFAASCWVASVLDFSANTRWARASAIWAVRSATYARSMVFWASLSSAKLASARSRATLALCRSAGVICAAGPPLARVYAVRALVSSTGGAEAHPTAASDRATRAIAAEGGRRFEVFMMVS